MKTESYSELLKDPRWQKKRLEILERDKWTCQSCNSTTKTLNIHHLLYIPGRNPWEYSNKLLLTLCEMCHKEKKNVTNLIYNESINEMIERALIDNKSLTFDNVTFFLSEASHPCLLLKLVFRIRFF